MDPAGAEPVFGLAEMTARTTVDWARRTVKLDDVKVISAKFPSVSAPGQRAAYLGLLREMVAKQVSSIALDRLEADLAIVQKQDATAAAPDPKRAAYHPVFGAAGRARLHLWRAALRSGQRTRPLSRVINTRVVMLEGRRGHLLLCTCTTATCRPLRCRAGQWRRKHPRRRAAAEDDGAQDRAARPARWRQGSHDRGAPDAQAGEAPRDLRGHHADRIDRHRGPR